MLALQAIEHNTILVPRMPLAISVCTSQVDVQSIQLTYKGIPRTICVFSLPKGYPWSLTTFPSPVVLDGRHGEVLALMCKLLHLQILLHIVA